MSSLTVSTIQSADAGANLSLLTGNSQGAAITVISTGGIELKSNSSTVAFAISNTGNIAFNSNLNMGSSQFTANVVNAAYLQFDTGDYFTYNTSTNKLSFSIGTVEKFGLSGTTANLVPNTTFSGTATFENNVVLNKKVTEKVHALSGTTPVLDANNGTIQTWTLSGTSTPTENMSSGDKMVLMISNAGGFTVNWPTMSWIGGGAPTLVTSGNNVIVLWKVSTTLHGSYTGSSS